MTDAAAPVDAGDRGVEGEAGASVAIRRECEAAVGDCEARWTGSLDEGVWAVTSTPATLLNGVRTRHGP